MPRKKATTPSRLKIKGSKIKSVHPSEHWTVEQKRQSLWSIRLGTRPHLKVFLPDFEKSPSAYLVPDTATNEVWSEIAWNTDETESPVSKWLRAQDFPLPAIQFKIHGTLDRNTFSAKKSPTFTFGIVKRASTADCEIVPNIQQLWFPPVWTQVFLIISSLAVIITSGLAVAPFRNELDDAQRRIRLLAWHLRQLVPEEATGGAEGSRAVRAKAGTK